MREDLGEFGISLPLDVLQMSVTFLMKLAAVDLQCISCAGTYAMKHA